MKRFLLPASALFLVVTACGAGAKPAPRLTRFEAQVPTVRLLAAERKRVAFREARELERQFVPPPGARRDPARRDHGGILSRPGDGPLEETVAARRYWRVHEPLASVVAFLKAHDPRGFKLLTSYSGTERPSGSHYQVRSLNWRQSRYLDENAVERRGHVVIRVEATVGWVYPRSPGEKVPASTREIVVHAPTWSVTVTRPAEVARIVRWFDALPVLPHVGVACALTLHPNIRLSFRSAGGVQLAQAGVPMASAGLCDPIGFKIAGRVRRPLIDAPTGESFARRLARLLRR